MKKNNNTVIILIVTMIIIIAFGFLNKLRNTEKKEILIELEAGTMLPKAKKITSFNIPSTKSNSLYNDLNNKWSLIFFGYSSCPHLCPKTLAYMNNISKLTNNENLQFVFVTIDPKRDTIEHLNSYLKTINPDFIGASGNIEDTLKLTKELNIYVANVDPEKVEHVDHSGSLVLISPNIEFSAIFTKIEDPNMVAKEIKTIQSIKLL